jgi:protein phosphatase
MVEIESAGITHVGMKREGNEDALFLDETQHLYVVADGMGGHQAGEVASALVVDTIRDYMKRFQEDSDTEEPDDPDKSLSPEANRLLAGIRVANRAVHDVANSKAAYHGMGSTVSAVFFANDSLIVANVGDSPIFLVHDGNIEQLSVTHNLITEQMAIDPDAARKLGPQYRHMLTRAMGIEETVKPDVSELPFFKGDMLVISSDGLSDKVNPEEILDVVKRESPQKAGQSLVNMANERGGEDNITVITLKVTSVRDNKKGFIKRLLGRLFPS